MSIAEIAQLQEPDRPLTARCPGSIPIHHVRSSRCARSDFNVGPRDQGMLAARCHSSATRREGREGCCAVPSLTASRC
eukprot:509685-Hanusia_phi.AAC.2